MNHLNQSDKYYPIPKYSNYSISKTGSVKNNITGNVLTGSINPAGYHLVRIKSDDGVTKTWGTHRLLGYVFLSSSYSSDKIINHKDGIKSNNSLDNLEWVTYKENAEHAGALQLTTKCIPVAVLDVNTNDVIVYPSATECGRQLGLSKDAVLWRLKVGENIVFPEGKRYRKAFIDRPWNPVTEVKTSSLTSRKVLVKYMKAEITLEFESLSAVHSTYNLSMASLSNWINDPEQPVIPGYLLIQWADGHQVWRDPGNLQLELDKTTGKNSIIVTDVKTGSEIVFDSAIDYSKKMNISKSTVYFWLKSNGDKEINGYTFKYYRDVYGPL